MSCRLLLLLLFCKLHLIYVCATNFNIFGSLLKDACRHNWYQLSNQAKKHKIVLEFPCSSIKNDQFETTCGKLGSQLSNSFTLFA